MHKIIYAIATPIIGVGLTVEQIAERLSLDVEAVRKAAQASSGDNSQGEDRGI